MNDSILFTPSAVLSVLSQIEELRDKEIYLNDDEDVIKLMIGNNAYNIETYKAEEISVPEEVLVDVEEANEDGFDDLIDEGWELPESTDIVEGGIIKELIKTLAVGGLVRLTKDAILKS